jgi:hypothetical protein
MPATTNVNFRTVVHEKSSGMAMFFPDVCKTPAPPAGPIPIPYPNIAQSTDTDGGSTKVKIDGCPIMLKDSNFKMSSGDEAGSAGGVMSSCTKGKAEFLNYSFDVKIEGKNVPRLGDMMLGNKKNTPPMPEIQPPVVMVPAVDNDESEEVEIDSMEETDSEDEDNGLAGGDDSRSLDTGAKEDAPPEEAATEEKEAVPTLKVKWGKAEIEPIHNKTWPPASPPTDDIPDECKVTLEMEATDVPEGTAASLEIFHAATGAMVKNGRMTGLKVKGNKVVDPVTGTAPEWSLPPDYKAWEPWDKPFFFFKASVDFKSLEAETPKDFAAKEAEALRLAYWHSCVSDAVADAGGLTTGPEMTEISGIITGAAHHKSYQHAFVAGDAANLKPLLGSAIRNTYVYHHSSHGNVGLIALVHVRVNAADLASKTDFPSMPRYLAYLNCCLTGKEPEFANAMIRRGTRNVIAFQLSIPDGDARAMARQFYNSWGSVHKNDPAKIATVFYQLSPAYTGSMEPILYGKDAESGGLSTLETVALVVGIIAVGVLIGVAAVKLLK